MRINDTPTDGPILAATDAGLRWVFPDGTMVNYAGGGEGDEGDGLTPPAPALTGIPVSGQPAPPSAPAPRVFSEAEVEAMRKQERDKLYPELSKAKERLKELEAQRKAEEDEKARLAAAEAEARRAAEEADLSAKDLLQRREQEWNSRFTELQEQQARQEALWEKERRFQEINAYRARAIAANSDQILPELQDVVAGNTEAEVDQSIQDLIARSASILENMRQANTADMQGVPGVSSRGPTFGPQDMFPGKRELTKEDIDSLDMAEYARIRQHLPTGRALQDRGLF